MRRRAAEPLDPGRAYELWAPTYPPSAHNPLMRIEQEAAAAILGALAPERALDVGTGSGRYLPILADTGARLVVGLDRSPSMLTRGTGGVRVCGDACRLPFQDGVFDLVSSFLMVGDVADLGAWTAEMGRVLAPGGHLVYSDFHPSWVAERWRRTFRTADGAEHEVSFFPHTIDEHLAHLEERGFDLRVVREPRLSAGRPPLVAIFHAVKRGLPGHALVGRRVQRPA
jgi:malonyl-CoA O-methyltransferase